MHDPASGTDDRAQTTQDYAVGIGLFLLAVVFVVTFLPSVLAPYDVVDDAERTNQAERIAIELIETTSTDDGRLTLDSAELDEMLDTLDDPTTVGLAAHRSVNVTLETLDGEDTVTSGGSDYTGAAAGSWTRIVMTDEACSDGCRLIVVVW